MSLVNYAESELTRIGMTDDDGMNGTMRIPPIKQMVSFRLVTIKDKLG